MRRSISFVCAAGLVFGAAALTAVPAIGASQRTFVKAQGGSDANPCTLAAPCRSFPAAIANTLPDGEVIVLDSGGFGAVTITQSVSIIAPPGVAAGITPFVGSGVTVNGPGIVVALQGLLIAFGPTGISFIQGAELRVSKCSIVGMGSNGISATAPGGRLLVSDTSVRDSGPFGIMIDGAVTAVLDRVRVENGVGTGIGIFGNASVSLQQSVVAGNGADGIDASPTSTVARVTIDDTVIARNAGNGAEAIASGAGAVAKMDIIRSTSTRNLVRGLVSSASAPALAVLTVMASMISENGSEALFAQSSGTALASGNTISRNAGGGFVTASGGVVHTRSNNVGEQTTPISGTVTPVPGF